MPRSSNRTRQPKSDAVERTADGFRARVRYGKGLRARFSLNVADEATAERRAERLREIADMLTRAGHSGDAPLVLRRAGEAASEREFGEIARVAEELCASTMPASHQRPTRLTFRELGEQWTSGTLHRRYPDQVKLKRTADHDAGRLGTYVYPVLGPKFVAEITLDDAEAVMRGLPTELSPLTRRSIGHLVARLLKLAVYPLRLIQASPIPPGFLPRRGTRKALAYLYPDEDRRLLDCRDVPFCYRLLWGFLAREGMREGEAIALTWSDLDLERGAVRLDKNKTDDRALGLWIRERLTRSAPTERAFRRTSTL